MSTSLLLTIIGGILTMIIIKSMIGYKANHQEQEISKKMQKPYVLECKVLEKDIPSSKIRRHSHVEIKPEKKQTSKVIDLQERRREKCLVLEKKTQGYSKIRL
ncbi:MAG: hypothetical protein E7231_02430 [Cellulosilyticum sp.]|nr:hypothetical protein [Cellulosilyticum sp.]